MELLGKHRAALDAVAEALLEKETIDGQEVAQIVQATLGETGVPHPSETTSNF
jgi:ATP-dependent Zn protease